MWQCYTMAVSFFGYPTLSSHVAVSHFPLLTKFLPKIQILPHRLSSCIRWPSSSSQYNICRHAATSDICALLVYLWHFLRKKRFPLLCPTFVQSPYNQSTLLNKQHFLHPADRIPQRFVRCYTFRRFCQMLHFSGFLSDVTLFRVFVRCYTFRGGFVICYNFYIGFNFKRSVQI